MVPILAVAWCAFRYRTRVTAWLLGSGVAAALPALLLFEVPVRNLLALLVTDSGVPDDPSWGFIASHYPSAFVELLRANVGFLRRGEWYTAAYFVVGVILLFVLVRRRPARLGTVGTLMRAGVVAGILYVLAAPSFSAFRLELVLVPMAAFGLALAVEAVTAAVRARVPERAAHAPSRSGAVGSSPHG